MMYRGFVRFEIWRVCNFYPICLNIFLMIGKYLTSKAELLYFSSDSLMSAGKSWVISGLLLLISQLILLTPSHTDDTAHHSYRPCLVGWKLKTVPSMDETITNNNTPTVGGSHIPYPFMYFTYVYPSRYCKIILSVTALFSIRRITSE